MSNAIPDLVGALARAVEAEGGRALMVGGWVRDALLGRPSKDVDVEVFGVPADRLRAILDRFGRVDTVGESFTVFKIGDVDVSLPRRESKTGRGHTGFAVTGDPTMRVEDAARRRDFTINAIARDPLTGEIVDPFDGRADLAARRLRAVDARTFADDSLRVLRALQFAARFELTVDDDTRALCRSMPLDDLPAERVWGEFEKLLLLAARPSIGLALARELRVLEQLLPELLPLAGCPQDPEWHPEGDVWTHTLMVVDQARARIAGLDRGPAAAVMLGALCHDIAKPMTTALIAGRLRSPGHEEAGVAPATAVLDRLNVHTLDGYDTRRTVLGLVAHHLKPLAFIKSPQPASDGAFRRLALKVDLELLARLALDDCHGRSGPFDCSMIETFLERARAIGVHHEGPAPLLQGRHLIALGVEPGPRMGEILRAVFEQQLDGTVRTTEEGIEAARRILSGS
jgi:tRNA nucleotidyltransferase (CCA-adding enzyme)